jgi:hypothetical protein
LVRLAPVRRDYPRLPLITPDYPWPGAVITSNLGSVARLARDGRNGNPLCRQRLWQMAVHQKMAVYDAGVGCTCAVRSLGLVSSCQIPRRWAVCDGGLTGGRGPSTKRALQAHCAWYKCCVFIFVLNFLSATDPPSARQKAARRNGGPVGESNLEVFLVDSSCALFWDV